jgi:hypothetical protein
VAVIFRAETTLEEWLGYLFARPYSPEPWYYDPDADLWDIPSARLVPLLAETFERSAELLAPYSDAQLSQGLFLLARIGYTAYLGCLLDEETPWPRRHRALGAMFHLFRDTFARRCTPHLSHLDEPGAGELNGVCYMWWDLMQDLQPPDGPRAADFDAEVVAVMGRVLGLPSDACRESALHGLGHWGEHCPWTADVIANFVKGSPRLRAELLEYARRAQAGDIL